MQYRQLGRTNLLVSAIGLGTWQFSGEWGMHYTTSQVDALLHQASDLGINLLDTAECYGDHLSEEMIGAAIRGARSRWIVATKFGHRYRGFLDVEERWSVADVRQQLEQSLRALRTDYIDLYQFHSGDDRAFDNDDLWRMLTDQKRAGSIRYLGVSLADSALFQGYSHQIRSARDRDVDVVQMTYNWLERRAEEGFLEISRALGLGTIVRRPLAGGYLSGKYEIGSKFPPNDVRAWTDTQTSLDHLQRTQQLRNTLRHDTEALSTWALAWCLSNGAVHCLVVGCKSTEQLICNARAVDLQSSHGAQDVPG